MKRIMLVIITLFSIIVTGTLWADATTANVAPIKNFSPEQIKQFQQVIHDYLVQNPEVLVEASNALDAKQAAKKQAAALKAIPEIKDQLFNDDATPMTGDKNAPVIVTEFFDYQCVHCKAVNTILQALIKANPNVRFNFKELPIFGKDSEFAAQAALAAAKQGKYQEFHEALLAAENPLTADKVWSIAKSLGLNVDAMKKDMDSADIKKQMLTNFQIANKLGVEGTPTFVLANKDYTKFNYIPGQTSQENLQTLIDALKKGK